MAFGPLVSLLVIRLASAELWGQFVNVMLIVQLGVHIVAWGNKEYLLRAFSLKPSQLSREWQISLFTRSILLVGLCLLIGILFPPAQVPAIILWALGLVLTQTHEVLILYRKDFIFAALVEAVGLVVLVTCVLWLGQNLSLNHLLLLFAATTLVKGLSFLIRFRKDTLPRTGSGVNLGGSFEIHYFTWAFTFFLLGFSGMLNSRIDLYTVNYFLPKSEVGHYQVFSNFMIYVQSISAFILMPFAKNVYRLQYNTISKISVRLFLFGLAILLPSLVAIHLILTYLYQFSLPTIFFIAGGLSILPIYFYLPIIYALYKRDLQTTVLKINIFGIGGSLILNIILLPRLGMVGAVITIAVMKWLALGIYLACGRTIRTRDASAVSELSPTSGSG